MGRRAVEDGNNRNEYPEELQIKLYQAFIFSIPILFSIILFLLFYLFYLKRRVNPATAHHSVSFISAPPPVSVSVSVSGWHMKEDNLQVVLFDQHQFMSRDSLCCVCLGEFEMEEELRQLPLCKHVFHGDCIRHWLRTNATCPLCRCPLTSPIKMAHPFGLVTHQLNNSSPQQQQQQVQSSSTSELEEHVFYITEPSSTTTAAATSLSRG